MADDSGGATTSPFFRLPRELRDKIYGLLLGDELWLDKSLDEGGFILSGHTLPSICLVNRQFGNEYREQSERQIGLAIDLEGERRERFIRIPENPKVNAILSKVRTISACYTLLYGDESDKAHLATQHRALRDHYLPHFSSVQCLRMFRFSRTDSVALQHHADPGAALDKAHRELFTLPVDFPYHVERIVSLKCQLFSLKRNTSERNYWSALEKSRENTINHLGTPSNGPYAWRGLDVRVERCGSWEEFEKWRVGFDAGWNAARESG